MDKRLSGGDKVLKLDIIQSYTSQYKTYVAIYSYMVVHQYWLYNIGCAMDTPKCLTSSSICHTKKPFDLALELYNYLHPATQKNTKSF